MRSATANFDDYRVPFWGRASVSIVVAASVAFLMLGLLLPESFAAPLIGLGLAGILAVRLFAVGTVRGLGTGTRASSTTP